MTPFRSAFTAEDIASVYSDEKNRGLGPLSVEIQREAERKDRGYEYPGFFKGLLIALPISLLLWIPIILAVRALWGVA